MKIPQPDISLGLATRDRASKIPPGAARDGSKNFWLYPDVLRSAPGHTRVTTELVDDHTILLDGKQFLVGQINGTGSLVNLIQPLATSAYTVEVFFRMDALPVNSTSGPSLGLSTLLYKGSGPSFQTYPTAANTDWWLTLFGQSEVYPRFSWDNGAGAFENVQPSGTAANPIKLGTFYHVAITRSAGAPGTIRMWGNFAGTTPTLSFFATGSSSSANPTTMDDTSGADLYVGAMPVARATSTSGSPDHSAYESQLTQFPFRGVIQEIRIWKEDRSFGTVGTLTTYTHQMTDAEIAAESNLVAIYRMTGDGTNRYFFLSEVGTAGTGSAQAPRLSLEPRQATWLVDGHTLGNPIANAPASIHFNGIESGIVVPDSYRYRSEQLNDDGTTAGTLNSRDRYVFTYNVRIDQLVDRATIDHWTHVPSAQRTTGSGPDYWTCSPQSTTLNGVVTMASGSTGAVEADEEWDYFIEVKANGGNFNFRAGVGYEASVAPLYRAAYVTDTATNLAVGTEYTVTVTIDFLAALISLRVNTATEVNTTLTSFDTSSTYMRATPDDPIGSYRKYARVLGRHMWRVTKLIDAPSDPNAVDIEYNFARSFNGAIRRVLIASVDVSSLLSTSTLSSLVHKYALTDNVTRTNLTALGVQFLSAWKMDEGKGTFIEDIGLLGNGLTFTEDPDHRWGKSGIVTEDGAGADGLFEHRYRIPTGGAKQIIAVCGGSVYELDLSAGTLTWITDGFRNDDHEIVSTLKFQDSTVFFVGGGMENFQLWKDVLCRLSIAPPIGPIPYGLSDQTSLSANLKPGKYIYTFTYYSRFQNKRSAPGPFISVEVWARTASVTFGKNAEINQTRPTTGASVNAETWNFEKNSGKISGFNFVAYYGTAGAKAATDPFWWKSEPGSGGSNEATQKRIKLTGNLFIKGANGSVTAAAGDHSEDEVTLEQLQNAISNKTLKCRIQELTDARPELVGAFAGANGRLFISDLAGENNTTRSGATLDWGVAAGGTLFTGSGLSNHGLSLPVSTDPQVTELEIWRTLAGGSQFRLVERVANGTSSYVDNKSDSDLTGEILDLNQGAVPPVRFATDFGDRGVYYGDPLAPQRLYISEPGQPWNVPPQNTIDFGEGSTLGITGVARTENALTIFKNDTTFVVTLTGDPDFPFHVESRVHDIGCVAPRGIVNKEEVFFYPDEQGFYGYDTSMPRRISEVITPTWDAVSAANFEKVVGVHDRKDNCLIWFVPSGDTVINGEVVNDEAIVWFYEKGADGNDVYGWSRLTGLPIRYATQIQDDDENNRVYLIDQHGFISLWNSGTNYGVGTLTSRTPALASGTFSLDQITVAQATLANLPSGYLGLPVTVVNTTTGERATRVCVEDDLGSPSVLRLDHDLPFMPAATGFSVIIGAIEMDWLTGDISPFGQDMIQIWKTTHLQMTPQTTSGNFVFRYIGNYGKDPAGVAYKTHSISNQRNEIPLKTETRGTRLAFGVQALGADNPVEIRAVAWDVESGDRSQYRDDQ